MAQRSFEQGGSITRPASRAVAITPHATNPLTFTTRGIYVGVSGTLVCRLAEDSADVTFTGLAAGVIHPLQVSHVRNTSTATNIVGVD